MFRHFPHLRLHETPDSSTSSRPPLSMRVHAPALPLPPDPVPGAPRSDWATLRKLLPYLWFYRWRVAVALGFLVAAKMANVGVPILLKHLVDSLAIKPGDPRTRMNS